LNGSDYPGPITCKIILNKTAQLMELLTFLTNNLNTGAVLKWLKQNGYQNGPTI
jgi:hypothetical protein